MAAAAIRPAPGGAHLIGSVPLKTASDVFTRTSQDLPNRLRSVPDGETGIRGYFIVWQKGIFPQAILQERAGGPAPDQLPVGTPKEAFTYTLADFKPTGYDEAALESYSTFKQLKNSGVIAADVSFQVCLPSPATATRTFVKTRFCQEAEALYEKRVLEALVRIQEIIPPSELTIQWDVVMEVCFLEYVSGRLNASFFEPYFGFENGNKEGPGSVKPAFSYTAVQQGIVDRLRLLASNVHSDATMGFHVCYGDVRHAHFVEPQDMTLLVRLGNELVRQLSTGAHPVAYVHMPVPKDRIDDGYFQPLTGLQFGHGEGENTVQCRLYLGAVHANDLDGTAQRIETARKFLPQKQLEVFGIATECGLGRVPVEDLDSILHVLKELGSPDIDREKL